MAEQEIHTHGVAAPKVTRTIIYTGGKGKVGGGRSGGYLSVVPMAAGQQEMKGM